MMSENAIARLRLESPADIAQLVPYLIGFTPEESLTIIAIDSSQVQVTARADLTDMQQWGAVEHLLDRIWAQFPDADAFLVAYTQDPEAGWAVLERCTDHLPADALQVTMLVDENTWHLPDGTHGLVEDSGQVSEVAASLGYQRVARRSDLEARFASAPDSPTLDATVRAALDSFPKYQNLTALLDHTRDLLHHNLGSRTPLGAGEASPSVSMVDAVHLTQLVQNRHARDFALASITKDTAPQHLALWSEVLGRLPGRFAEVPAAIAGMAAWVAGDGTSANIALTRAQAEARSPRESGPAELLDAVLDRVLPPSAWPSVRGWILEHADQRVHHALTTHPRPTGVPAPVSEPRRVQPTPQGPTL